MTTMENCPPFPDRMRRAGIRSTSSLGQAGAVQRIAEALRRRGVLTATSVLDRLRPESAGSAQDCGRKDVADGSGTDTAGELPWRAA